MSSGSNRAARQLRDSEAVVARMQSSKKEIEHLRADYERLLERGMQSSSALNITDHDKQKVMQQQNTVKNVATASGITQRGRSLSGRSTERKASTDRSGPFTPTRVRHYDVEEAREYIKKQKERRLQQLKECKENDNAMKIKKQKLLELHQKSRQIVARNRERSKSREKQKPGSSQQLPTPQPVPMSASSRKSESLNMSHIKPHLAQHSKANTYRIPSAMQPPSTTLSAVAIPKSESSVVKTTYTNGSAKSDDAKIKAATMIQAYFRGHTQRKIYRDAIERRIAARKKRLREQLEATELERIRQEVADSICKEQEREREKEKWPDWLQPEPEMHPYNFITSVKRKISAALSTPVKTSDIGIQSSFAADQDDKTPPNTKEVRERIELSLSTKKSDKELNAKIAQSLQAIRDIQREEMMRPLTLESDSIRKKRLDNVDGLDLRHLNLKLKAIEASDSDTSKNIPDISTESQFNTYRSTEKSESSGVSTTRGSTESVVILFKQPNEPPLKPKRMSRLDTVKGLKSHSASSISSHISTSKSDSVLSKPLKQNTPNDITEASAAANLENDDFKLAINFDKLKELKLRRRRAIPHVNDTLAGCRQRSELDSSTEPSKTHSMHVEDDSNAYLKSASLKSTLSNHSVHKTSQQSRNGIDSASRRGSNIAGNISEYTRSFESYKDKQVSIEENSPNDSEVSENLQSFRQYMNELDETQKITHTPFQPKTRVQKSVNVQAKLQEVFSKVKELQNDASDLKSHSKYDYSNKTNSKAQVNGNITDKNVDNALDNASFNKENDINNQNEKVLNVANLEAPDLKLAVSNSIERQPLCSKVAETTIIGDATQPNHIHVKFEAQLHLLNDFNESLKQVMNIEKTMLDLQTKYNLMDRSTTKAEMQNRTSQTTINQSESDVKTLFYNNVFDTDLNVANGTNAIEKSINFSRSSDVENLMDRPTTKAEVQNPTSQTIINQSESDVKTLFYNNTFDTNLNVANRTNANQKSINFSRGSDAMPKFVRDLQQSFNLDISNISAQLGDVSTTKTQDDTDLRQLHHTQTTQTIASYRIDEDCSLAADNMNTAGISLGMFDQLIRDEDARIDNLRTVLRIRAKALLDRTKSELAWLEIQRMHLCQSGKEYEASILKKKQRGIIVRLYEEKNEMKRMKEAQRVASQERKCVLKDQRDVIKAQLSGGSRIVTRFKRSASGAGRTSMGTAASSASGPVKVYNYRSETSVSRKSGSSTSESVVYASRSESIISQVLPPAGKDDDAGSTRNEIAKRSLQMREAALQKRRKEAESLLRWHQKLVREERKIVELEMAASNIINTKTANNIELSPHKVFDKSQSTEMTVIRTPPRPVSGGEEENAGSRTTPSIPSKQTTAYSMEFEDNKGTDCEDNYENIETEQSKSTLNEIMLNISNITDEISELYKMSKIPKCELSLKESARSAVSEMIDESLTSGLSEQVATEVVSSEKVLAMEGDETEDDIPSIKDDIVTGDQQCFAPTSIILKSDGEHKSLHEIGEQGLQRDNESDKNSEVQTNSNIADFFNKLRGHKEQLQDDSCKSKEATVANSIHWENAEITPNEVTKTIQSEEPPSDSKLCISPAHESISNRSSPSKVIEDNSFVNNISSPIHSIVIQSQSPESNRTNTDHILKSNEITEAVEEHSTLDGNADLHSSIPSVQDLSLASIVRTNECVNLTEKDSAKDGSIPSSKYGSEEAANCDTIHSTQNNIHEVESKSEYQHELSTPDQVSSIRSIQEDANETDYSKVLIEEITEVLPQESSLEESDDYVVDGPKDNVESQLEVNTTELNKISEGSSMGEEFKNTVEDIEEVHETSKNIPEVVSTHTEDVDSFEDILTEVSKTIHTWELPENGSVENVTPSDDERDLQQNLSGSSVTIQSQLSESSQTSSIKNIFCQPVVDVKLEEKHHSVHEGDNSPDIESLPASSITDEDIASALAPEDESDNSSDQKSSIKQRVSKILADANLNATIEEKSPRLPDIYVTTYDVISPDHSPELGSPVDNSKSKLKDVYGIGNEAQELLKKQLAIEQEIKQIERQQKELPYITFVREIPNKPPPPYTPPIQPSSSIIPSSVAQIDEVVPHLADLIYDSYADRTLDYLTFPAADGEDRQCAEFLFDICKELAIEHYAAFEETETLAWTKQNKRNTFKRPHTRTSLETMFKQRLKQLFGFEKVLVKESMIIKWSRKKRDHVDELLVVESQAEETEWTNYDRDEVVVKDEVTNTILDVLLTETAVILQEIFAKRKGPTTTD